MVWQKRIAESQFFQGIALMLLALVPFLTALNSYYYIDDGLSLRLGKEAAEKTVKVAFSLGFNGHFRPLPILTWCAIHQLFGPDSPVPYHVFSVLLHVANVWLTWRWVRYLTQGNANGLAWLVAAIFAVHWFATEAVTYISAVGVLWSMLGGLCACFGVIFIGQGAKLRGALAVWLGLLIALGGGEYGVSVIPMVLITAALHPAAVVWKTRIFNAIMIGLLILPVLIAYVTIQALFISDGRLGTIYMLGWHVVENTKEHLARLFFPNGWIGGTLSFWLLFLLALVPLLFNDGRSFYRQPLPCLAALGAVASLAPYIPSQLGNYGRFLYITTPMFTIWLLELFGELRRLLVGSASAQRKLQFGIPALAGFLLVAHFIHLEKCIWAADKHAEPLRQLVIEWRAKRDRYPDFEMKLFGKANFNCPADVLYSMNLIQANQRIEESMPRSPADREIQLILAYDCIAGFRDSQWRCGHDCIDH